MTTTTYQTLIDQLDAEAAQATERAAEAERKLREAAALVEARKAAQHAADGAKRARDRHAVELRALRHKIAMIDHALRVADLVEAIGPALDAADATARAAVQAMHGHGPIGMLRELRRTVTFYAGRRAYWVKERADTVARLAAAERAGPADSVAT